MYKVTAHYLPVHPISQNLQAMREDLDRHLLELLDGEGAFAAALREELPNLAVKETFALGNKFSEDFRNKAEAAGLDGEKVRHIHGEIVHLQIVKPVIEEFPDVSGETVLGILPIMLGGRNDWGEFVLTHAEQFSKSSLVHLRFRSLVPNDPLVHLEPMFTLAVNGPDNRLFRVTEMGGGGSNNSRSYQFALQPALPADLEGINFCLLPPELPNRHHHRPEPKPLEDALDLAPLPNGPIE